MDNLRRVALWSVLAILIFMLVADVMLIASMMQMDKPNVPQLIASTDISQLECKKKEIENYSALISVLQSQRTNIFDHSVTKTLLPLFNSLITYVLIYIFGAKAMELTKNYIDKK
jgi:hypothetical protein